MTAAAPRVPSTAPLEIAFTPPARFDTLPPIAFDVDITDEGQRKREERSFVGIQDDEGHLWFALTDDYTVHRVPRGSAADVFMESGIYLGRMTFPAVILTEGPPPHVTERHIWAVVEDELGIPFVVRYRIERPER